MLLHTRKHYGRVYRYSDIYIHVYIDFPISWLHLFITQVDKSTLTVDYKCIQMFQSQSIFLFSGILT